MKKTVEIDSYGTVYEPSDDSWLLEAVVEREIGRESVLDMGTGSGIQAIAAAKKGADVTAADINSEALKCAQENAKRNEVEIKTIESDLFSKITEKFDTIIFNPPYVHTDENEIYDLESAAWQGGREGRVIIDEFLLHAFEFLKPDGRILLLVSSQNNILEHLEESCATRILAREKLFFEELFVLELRSR
jgi:release factor glutamine methyltransferase